ncbi:hypothetical protein KHS38_18855 [Mucilaginibacter sp. Bleaf8]|uniref:DUF5977 domain-containing protein n=1 Tax=Mucilaginibacter sp. Bleaf8 TaxID=2834430 RepID=UPI001BD10098|nr:DUF5977 domain-containing protein [Mucilaginibacter sp. Bleaf8]MBS7566472.1 hypothetical protein [Mucilaginibacter sp. Bleaf8]
MTKILNKLAFLTCLIFLSNVLLAQQLETKLNIPTYTVHSPNVTALGRYEEYPVNTGTGVPSIEIPLYTIKGKKLQLPISLSYHASGIRVDQEASFVGLGWVLNAGGIISRVIKDKPDEQAYGFMELGKALPNYNTIGDDIGDSQPFRTGYSETLKQWAIYNDKQPDLFSMQTSNLNAEFSLNNSGKFINLNLDSIKFEADLYGNKIVVTDKQGNTYRFGTSLDNQPAFETPRQYNSTSTSSTHVIKYEYTNGNLNYVPRPATWYLTEIISADHSDTISFKYKDVAYHGYKLVNMVRFMLDDQPNLSTVDKGGNEFDGLIKSFIRTDIADAKMIDKIVFNSGYIQFLSANDRQDVIASTDGPPTHARLTGFILFDSKGNIMRKVGFENNVYFERTASGMPMVYSAPMDPVARKSLKLNGVVFYNGSSKPINRYSFDYNETPLPPRQTTPQDYWGYYNGKNNESMIPQNFFTKSNGNPVAVGEDRKADFNYTKAGILNKVVFPTGGYTTYEYEPNYYLNDSQKQGQAEMQRKVTLYAINRDPACTSDFLTGVPANNSLEFQVNENLGGSINNGNITLGKLYVMFSDYKVSTNLPMTFKITDLTNSDFSYSFTHWQADRDQRKVLNLDIVLYEGHKYKMEAYTNGVTGSIMGTCNSPYIEAGLSYHYYTGGTPAQIMPEQAGGLRIKKISTYDIDSKIVSQKAYEYGDVKYGPSSVGVGEILTDPSKNFYYSPLLYQDTEFTKSLKRVIWFASNSSVELGSNQGCAVSYDKVTEKSTSVGNSQASNGKTEYQYYAPTAYYEPKSSGKFPYVFKTYPSWMNSRIKSVIFYKSDNAGAYYPVKSTSYEYELSEKRIKTFVIDEYEPFIWSGNNWLNTDLSRQWVYQGDNPNNFYYFNYFVSYGRTKKSKEITREFVNGIESSTVEKTFTYNNQNEIAKEEYTNSKAELVQNTMKYTSDLNYTNLISKNMLSLPVQEEQLVNGKVVSGTIVKYNDFGAISERYAAVANSPKDMVPYVSAASLPPYYEKKETVDYDWNNKNLKQVKSEKGINTNYLWSYGGQYPIAIIRNADSTAIANVLGADNIKNYSKKISPPDEAVRSFLSRLRTQLPNAEVATYTYNPLAGLTSQADPRGNLKYYEYDTYQRLRNVKDQNGKITESYCYNYAGQLQDCAPLVSYASAAMDTTVTRNNCGLNSASGNYTYYLAAGKYTSFTSQGDANAMAHADMKENAQTLANQYGSCSSVSGGVNLINNTQGLNNTITVQLKLGTTVLKTMTFPNASNANAQYMDIPAGNYTLAINIAASTPRGFTIYRDFNMDSPGESKSGTSVTFTNVNISAGYVLPVIVY